MLEQGSWSGDIGGDLYKHLPVVDPQLSYCYAAGCACLCGECDGWIVVRDHNRGRGHGPPDERRGRGEGAPEERGGRGEGVSKERELEEVRRQRDEVDKRERDMRAADYLLCQKLFWVKETRRGNDPFTLFFRPYQSDDPPPPPPSHSH